MKSVDVKKFCYEKTEKTLLGAPGGNMSQTKCFTPFSTPYPFHLHTADTLQRVLEDSQST
jgi:hypothetical protein